MDRYGYIGIETLLRFCENSKDHAVTPNDFMRMPRKRRPRGRWIDEGFYADGHGAHAFRCSECGGHIIEYDEDPFCRWCGADMRQREEEQE